MAELSSTAVATLSTLVTATVFSTTFLSGRVHRERGRAVDRALKLGDSWAERVERAEAGETHELSGVALGWLDQQAGVLERGLAERFSLVLVGMNIVLALAVTSLAIVFGSQAGIRVWPLTTGPAAWVLIAYVATALLVVGVGTLDVLMARQDVREQFEQTPIGRMLLAQRSLAAGTKSPGKATVDQAREFAEDALVATGGRVAQAWATLGYVHLLGLTLPPPRPPNTLRDADRCLRRAIEIGPATAPMWAARALIAEAWDQEAEAVDRWLAAIELLAQNSDISMVISAYTQSPASDTAPDGVLLPLSREQRVRISGTGRSDVYSMQVKPVRITTYSGAVDRLDSDDPRTVVAAQWLVMQAGRDPANVPFAKEALERLFQRLATSESGFRATLTLGNLLLLHNGPKEIRELVQHSIDEAWNIRLERLTAPFREFQRRSEENRRKAGVLLAEIERIAEDSNVQEEEFQARQRRIREGSTTPEDDAFLREAEQRVLDPAYEAEFKAREERFQEWWALWERRRERQEEFDRRRAQLQAEMDRVAAIKSRGNLGFLRPGDPALSEVEESQRVVSQQIELLDEERRADESPMLSEDA